MFNSKKGLSVITSTVLLLLVAISTGILIFNWYVDFQGTYTDEFVQQGKVGALEIKELKISGVGASIGVKNKGDVYHQIDTIKINGVTCIPSLNYVVVEAKNLIVDCSVSIGSTYVVDVFSNNGIFSRTISVFE